jgi:hypothetical protein
MAMLATQFRLRGGKALFAKYWDFRYVIPFMVESGNLQRWSHAAQNAGAIDAGRTNFRQLRGY